MYVVYGALAFAEVFVLFASFLAVLALIVRAAIRACCKLKNWKLKPMPQCALSFSGSGNPCWVQCRHRLEPRRA
jgi:hypothetical protein